MAHNADVENGNPAPVAANAVTPSVIPTLVEPVSGQLIEKPPKRGKVKPEDSVRMGLILAFTSGQLPATKDKRIQFIRKCDLTVNEKAYLVRHPYFKELYDARLFDMMTGIEEPTKEDLKIMHLVALRTGLAKPQAQVSINSKHTKVDSKDSQVSIQVQKA